MVLTIKTNKLKLKGLDLLVHTNKIQTNCSYHKLFSQTIRPSSDVGKKHLLSSKKSFLKSRSSWMKLKRM